MYPVWVKLGDFGEPKWIQPPGITTLCAPVSTLLYSAPEVLRLDSNGKSSEYTNSVDIWSLGCVIYELLVGTRLFVSGVQVCRYYFGKWPFPEDTLRGLSPPTDDAGIFLLKSMLLIQPEDRPTAADALNHVWLAGLESGGEERAQSERYKLDTEFFQDYVRHTRYIGKEKNKDKKVKEGWSNCGELGRGGFGVVYKQIQKTTGRYRAVKTINKRLLLRLDYSRELLVMAKLAKVCILTLEEIFSSLLPLWDYLVL